MHLFRGRGRRLHLLMGIALILLLLGADALYAGLRFRATFKSSACNLKRATDQVGNLEVDRAGERLETALDQAIRSHSYLSHPSVALASFLPLVRDDVRALRALTEVAEDAAKAGLSGVVAAEKMGIGGAGSLSALYANGRVQFDAIEQGRVAIDDAAAHLAAAGETLAASPRPRLGQVRNAFFSAGRLVTEAIEQLDDGERILSSVPSLLGGRGTRRYLLAFQTPSEARGGGGLIGVYGVLRAADGKLELESIAPIRSLVPKVKGSVTAPRWFEDLYRNLDAQAGIREANQSPSFPTVAQVLLRMYEAAEGERLDGMISMDPLVLAELTNATGPIDVKEYDEPLGPDNAATVLLRDIYLDFVKREDEQNAFLEDLVDQLYSKLGSGDVDGRALVRALAESIRTQHLKMYARSPVEQQALRELGVAGDPTSYRPNVQMVFHNNFAANKIDWFLERSQDITVAIDSDGSARFVTTVELENTAPPGQRSLLKKSDVNELPSGLNVMSLHFLLPETAKVEDFYLDNTLTSYFEGFEGGIFPVAWKPLQLRVQDSASATVTYTIPDLVDLTDEEDTFTMTFLPQALVRPDGFAIEVIPPEGYRIGRNETGARFSQRFTKQGELTGVRELSLRLVGPGQPLPGGTTLAAACG